MQAALPAQSGAGRVTRDCSVGEVAFGRRAGLARGNAERPPPISYQDMAVAALGPGGRAAVPSGSSPNGKLGCPAQPDHAKRGMLPHSIPVDNAVLHSKRVMTFGTEQPMERQQQARPIEGTEIANRGARAAEMQSAVMKNRGSIQLGDHKMAHQPDAPVEARKGIRMRSDQARRDDAVADDILYGRDLGGDRRIVDEGLGQGKDVHRLREQRGGIRMRADQAHRDDAMVDDILYGRDLGGDRRIVDEGRGQGKDVHRRNERQGGIRMRADQARRDDAVVDDLLYGRDLGADRSRVADGRGQGKACAAVVPGSESDIDLPHWSHNAALPPGFVVTKTGDIRPQADFFALNTHAAQKFDRDLMHHDEVKSAAVVSEAHARRLIERPNPRLGRSKVEALFEGGAALQEVPAIAGGKGVFPAPPSAVGHIIYETPTVGDPHAPGPTAGHNRGLPWRRPDQAAQVLEHNDLSGGPAAPAARGPGLGHKQHGHNMAQAFSSEPLQQPAPPPPPRDAGRLFFSGAEPTPVVNNAGVQMAGFNVADGRLQLR